VETHQSSPHRGAYFLWAFVQKTVLDIPLIDAFLARRTWRYIEKAYRESEETLQKKFLGAWIHAAKKSGRPQATCRDNFIYSQKRIMPDEIDEDGNFNGWVRYAKNEETWNEIVDQFFGALGKKVT